MGNGKTENCLTADLKRLLKTVIMEDKTHAGPQIEYKGHYMKLLFMTVLSFIAMYILMYSMVNNIHNVYPNINQFYMQP
jgi:hypothetical protein